MRKENPMEEREAVERDSTELEMRIVYTFGVCQEESVIVHYIYRVFHPTLLHHHLNHVLQRGLWTGRMSGNPLLSRPRPLVL